MTLPRPDLTGLLLLTICSFPPDTPAVFELSLSPAFIEAIGHYITHLDPSVRRCGMLAAEVVAKRTGKSLDFDDWQGETQGRAWAHAVRHLITGRDVDALPVPFDVVRLDPDPELPVEVVANLTNSPPSKTEKRVTSVRLSSAEHDSDDSLTGYDSPPSSRAPSPTLSEVEEVEKDPTLRVGKKKIQKPVYLADLGSMLRSLAKADDPDEADRIDIALGCAEELIRKKRGFGFELGELLLV